MLTLSIVLQQHSLQRDKALKPRIRAFDWPLRGFDLYSGGRILVFSID